MSEPRRKEPDDDIERPVRHPPKEDPANDESPRRLPPRDPDRPDDPELPNEDRQEHELDRARTDDV